MKGGGGPDRVEILLVVGMILIIAVLARVTLAPLLNQN